MKKSKILLILIPFLLWNSAAFGQGESDLWNYFEARAHNKNGKVFLPISLEEEIALGTEIAIEINRRFRGIWDNPRVHRYVNLVGMNIGRVSARPRLHYSFAILDTPVVNAFALPGGLIFVTRGALELMENEAQLAGVLAHEVAHVSRKHALESFGKERKKTLLRKIDRKELEKNPTLVKKIVAKMKSDILDSRPDDKMEIESDLIARILLARLGYDPDALLRYLKNSRAKKRGRGAYGDQALIERRIRFLSWVATPDVEGGNPKKLEKRFRSIMKKSR